MVAQHVGDDGFWHNFCGDGVLLSRCGDDE